MGYGLPAAIGAQLAMPCIGLDVRMGLHTGVTPERIDGDFRGPPVNRAARIMSKAYGGQILLSDAAARLVAPDLGQTTLVSLGIHHLRGLLHPDRLWQVVHPGLRRDFPRQGSHSSRPLHRGSTAAHGRAHE